MKKKATDKSFRFYTRLHLKALTALKASNITGLVELIRKVPGSSIYYHTHHFLQQHQYLSPEPPNDFAHWIRSALNEEALAEKLASIDTIQYPTIRSLRNEIARIISGYIRKNPSIKLRFASPDKVFHFIKSISFVLPTPYVARNLKDFVWCLDYGVWLFFSPYKFDRLPSIKSVLVVEDIGIGDLLVSTPVFRALKKKFGRVDVLVKPGMESVLEGNLNVDNVVTSVDRKYDLGVILHARTNGNYKMSRILKKSCKYRIGCTRVGLKEGKGFLLNRKTLPNFKSRKKIEDNLDVIRTIGVEGDGKLEAYTNFKPKVRNYVVFHTHGAYKTHNWYAKKWVELAKKLDKKVVFTGTNEEYVQSMIAKFSKGVDATGSTIQEYFGWIKHADYVVTVDTSAMHVAAAFDVPVISLFGAGDPRVWKANSTKSVVIRKGDCHSCHKTYCRLKDHRCMALIEPDDVLEAIGLIGKTV